MLAQTREPHLKARCIPFKHRQSCSFRIPSHSYSKLPWFISQLLRNIRRYIEVAFRNDRCRAVVRSGVCYYADVELEEVCIEQQVTESNLIKYANLIPPSPFEEATEEKRYVLGNDHIPLIR
jgi:hypothetical protein